jgi:acetylornithine deacetylase/succinyl-diaminopimelate desuccinylase-like protein
MQTLKAPAIHIPVGQSSDAPHLPNERIRLLNLVTGMKVLETFFQELAASRLGAPSAGADAEGVKC